MRWAVEHGLVGTLKNVDEVEDIASFLRTTLNSSSEAGGLELSLIHQAALYGHAGVIDYLLQKGADVNASTATGLLPLHLAKTGEVVHLLAHHGGRLDHDEAAPSGVSALMSSISHQCEASAVTAFLALGADPNQVARDGATVAEVAIVHGNVDALRVLVDSGVDVNKALPSGGFLLYKAIWLGARVQSAEITKTMATMLLDRGASPNCGFDETLEPQYGSRPCHTPTLFLAAMMRGSADLVQLLLERGADQFLPYTQERGCFHGSNGGTIRGFDATYSKSLVANVVGGIVDCGSYPQDPDALRKLELLVQYGGDIDAIIKGHLRLVERIALRRLLQLQNLYGKDTRLDMKAPIHTPLMWCLLQDGSRAEKALNVIPALVALGADVNHVDQDGNRPLHLLCGSFYHQVQRYNAKGLTYSGSYWRAKMPHAAHLTSLLDLFVNRGADPNAGDARGRTPLMLLCQHPHTIPTAFFIEVLLRHRCVDIQAVDRRGWTALHYATGDPPDPFHDEPCLRLLVLLRRVHEGDGGADPLGVDDVNACRVSGRTPLHLLLEARDRGPSPADRHDEDQDTQHRLMTKTRALTMLVHAGADVRARTGEGRLSSSSENTITTTWPEVGARGGAGDTPLHLALLLPQESDMLLTTRFLLRHGAAADVNYVSPGLGLTPLMMVAAAAGRGELSRNATEDMCRLLLGAGADARMRDNRGRTAWDIFVEIKGSLPVVSPWRPCLEMFEPRDGDLGTVDKSSGEKGKLALSEGA